MNFTIVVNIVMNNLASVDYTVYQKLFDFTLTVHLKCNWNFAPTFFMAAAQLQSVSRSFRQEIHESRSQFVELVMNKNSFSMQFLNSTDARPTDRILSCRY